MTNAAESYTNITSAPPNFVGEQIDEGARVFFILVGAFIILSGVVGNCLFLSLIFKQFRRKQSLHILFVANLSLADLLTLGYWFTFFVLDLILHRHPVANFAHCVANGVVIGTLFTASVSFLVSISLNRYLHVCHSHLYSRVFTLPRTVAWCLLTWLFSLFLALVPLMDTSSDTPFDYNRAARVCSYNREGTDYVEDLVIVVSVLPMPFIAYFNFAIFRQWRKARFSTAARSPLANAEKEKTVFARLAAFVTRGQSQGGSAGVELTARSTQSERSLTDRIEVSDSGFETDISAGNRSGCGILTRESSENQGPDRNETVSTVSVVDAEIHDRPGESLGKVAEDRSNVQSKLLSQASWRISVDFASWSPNKILDREDLKPGDADLRTDCGVEEIMSGKRLSKFTDVPKSTNDQPKSTKDLPKSTLPKSTKDLPKSTKDLPKSTKDLPKSTEDLPKSTKDLPKSTKDSQVAEHERSESFSDDFKRKTSPARATSKWFSSLRLSRTESARPGFDSAEEGRRELSETVSQLPRPVRPPASESTRPTSAVSVVSTAKDSDPDKTPAQHLQKSTKRKRAREVALVRSLFVVFILTVFSFIPFGAVIAVSARVHVPPEVVILGNLFLFFNNSVNWIVYGAMNPVFKRGYVQYGRRLLAVCCRLGALCARTV